MECNVHSILGITETELTKLSAKQKEKFITSNGTYVNKESGQETSFGKFQVLKVSELRQRVQALVPQAPRTRPLPNITTKSGVDIGQLQATLTTQDAAMVQVASNFNTLENGSAHMPYGSLVDKACYDNAQGPAAVFGALSGYLYRAHFFEGGQTNAESGVNLLEHVSKYFGVPVTGKLLLRGTEKAIRSTDAEIDAVVSDICVGVHVQCPIMFGRDEDYNVFHNRIPESGKASFTYPMVDQLFTASIDLGYIGEMSKECKAAFGGNTDQAAHHMARTLLRAAYEATYLAAIEQQRKTLLLTLIGGGSFANPIELVVEEMKRAHSKWAGHPASALNIVQVCLFDELDELQVKRFL